jgi:hypothetical protein
MGKDWAIKDETGKTFHYWTVLKRDEAKKQKPCVYWICQCKCGKIKSVSSNSLRRNETKSCGCATNYFHEKNTDRQEQIKRNLYCMCRNSALKRKLSFLLTVKQYSTLIGEKCFYCGEEPKQKKYDSSNRASYILCNGIDRLDNKRGYEVDNCIPCCHNCNWAKLDSEIWEFSQWVNRISKNFPFKVEKGFDCGSMFDSIPLFKAIAMRYHGDN